MMADSVISSTSSIPVYVVVVNVALFSVVYSEMDINHLRVL